MFSSSSEIRFGPPRALCSANLALRSSRETGSPDEVRRRVKRRERSGKMRDVRKLLAGGSSGRCWCSAEDDNTS
ncbi:hypothetical protein SERLA73DRAFT_142158 [Serpula lacrymans var. lacrymans S7.3]|uniref:Uncharacterized protein n=1 Tax=Serpula lacrymans var. lacrymans (strain S7.3) TaxID=936435 RepID=F8Q7B9_SERL3|nr:hypothetical protein SERLA73DRAFT_142158 [Serpula lacrymans var. lacrymans S7.3]